MSNTSAPIFCASLDGTRAALKMLYSARQLDASKTSEWYDADSENGNQTGCIGKGGATTHTRVANGLQELLPQNRSDLDN